MIRVTAVLALACVAACGRPARESDTASIPPAAATDAASTSRMGAGLATRDCSRARGDSAQAVCLGLNEIERITSMYAEAHGIERRGDTICVHTGPDRQHHPMMLDGGGAVEVVRGKVIASLTGDSVPCPRDAAWVREARSGTKENDVD